MSVRVHSLFRISAQQAPPPPPPPPELEHIEIVNDGTAYGTQEPNIANGTTQLTFQDNRELFDSSGADLLVWGTGLFNTAVNNQVDVVPGGGSNVWIEAFSPYLLQGSLALRFSFSDPTYTGPGHNFLWATAAATYPSLGVLALRNWNSEAPTIKGSYLSPSSMRAELATPLEINRNGIVVTFCSWRTTAVTVRQPEGYSLARVIPYIPAVSSALGMAWKSGELEVENPVWIIEGNLGALAMGAVFFEAIEQRE